jgi:hypothetical protein
MKVLVKNLAATKTVARTMKTMVMAEVTGPLSGTPDILESKLEEGFVQAWSWWGVSCHVSGLVEVGCW